MGHGYFKIRKCYMHMKCSAFKFIIDCIENNFI